MNREYLNVIVADDDQSNLLFFRDIFRDLKIGIKMQAVCNGDDLIECLNSEASTIPEVLFISYTIPGKNSMKCLEEIKFDDRFSDMVNAVYAEGLSEAEIEEIFVKGAHIFMEKPVHYSDLKRVLSEVITINWQYHTSGLNKDNFIMRV